MGRGGGEGNKVRRPCAPPDAGDNIFDLLFASSIAASLRFFALETIGPPGVELGVYGLPLIRWFYSIE